MLPKDRRIQKKEFSSILKVSNRRNSPHFTLYFTNTNPGRSKFSVSVSNKVAKSAVDRNKVRRRVYTTIGKCLPNINDRYYFIFVSKKGVEVAKFTSLNKEIVGLISDFFV